MFPPIGRFVLAPLILLLVALPPHASGDEAEDQYEVAAGHYARRRWELAAEAFGTYLQRFPKHPKAEQSVFFMGEALSQQGRPERAAKQFAEYLRRVPEGPYARAARFRLGEAAYLAGQFQEARRDLEAFDQKHPDDALGAYVLPYLGEIALGEDNAAEAADRFRRALKRFPNGPLQNDCRLGLARSLGRLGKHQEASKLYQALVAQHLGSLSAEARFRLGALQYARGAYGDATATLQPLEEHASAGPWRPRASLVRALALRKLGQFDGAAALLAGITSDPTVGVRAQYWLAAVRKDQKQWDAAAKILLAAARQHPEDSLIPAMRFHAGHALLRAGRATEAAEQFDVVLKLDERAGTWLDDAAMGRIQIAMRKKDHQAVDRQAKEFLQRFPDSSLADDVRRTWASSMLARGKHTAALDVLRPLAKIERDQPHFVENRYLLALAYRGKGELGEALDLLEPAITDGKASRRPQANARLLRTTLLVELERFDDAVEPLEAFLATGPTGRRAIKARAQLALSLARLGKWKTARAQLQTLLEQHAPHPMVAAAVEQLAEVAYGQRNWAEAAELFTWMVERSGREPYVLRGLSGLGWTQLESGQLAPAAATFERLLDREPEAQSAARAAWARGYILERLGRLDAALTTYHTVIDRHPESRQMFDLLLAAARLHDRMEQREKAATLYRRITTEYPKQAGLDAVLYEWSWTLLDGKRPEEAAALFERLRKEFPESRYWADATYRLAERAAAAKDQAGARRLVDEVLAAKPSADLEQHALALKCQVNATDQRWDQVVRTAEQLIEKHPESPFRLIAELWVAESLYRRADYGAAAERLDALTAKAQAHDESWLAIIPLRRAQILARNKKWADAYRLASKIEQDYPGFDSLYEVDYLLGRCLAARAEFDEARGAYRRVIGSPQGAKTETAAMAQWMIGETYFHQKNYEAALREYLRVEILYDFPRWQAAALLQAGKCHEQLGQIDEAKQLYRCLVETYPDSPFTERAKKRSLAAAARRGTSEAKRRPSTERRRQ